MDSVFRAREGGTADAINFEVDQLATPGFKPSESTIKEVLDEQASILEKVDASNLALDPEKGGKSIAQLKKEHGDAYITPTSAMGKFQVTGTTLASAVKRLGISEDTVFTEEVQEQIMVEFLMRSKQPSLKKYFDADKPSKEQLKLALKGLGKEWEAFDLDKNPDAQKDAVKVLQSMHKHFNEE